MPANTIAKIPVTIPPVAGTSSLAYIDAKATATIPKINAGIAA